ncbi:MAG TPA: hypothetical protein VH092_21845, partial [Urbifossiella sp.]|nr:hypothetical protein [Urbifossiella sp.]
MTPPPEPADPPGPWPDVLAAYADGELDAAGRAVVERWLDAHPGAHNCVRAQRALSPENWRLWRDAEPPMPDESVWENARDAIAAGIARQAEPVALLRSRRRVGRVLAVVACGLALFVTSVGAFGPWFLPRPVAGAGPESSDDQPAEFAVLPIATDTEVDVQRVDVSGGGGWLPVGGMPLSGPLTLATADDVEVEGAEEHPAWPGGPPRVTRDPADAPVL